jgi:hypothetical protein
MEKRAANFTIRSVSTAQAHLSRSHGGYGGQVPYFIPVGPWGTEATDKEIAISWRILLCKGLDKAYIAIILSQC